MKKAWIYIISLSSIILIIIAACAPQAPIAKARPRLESYQSNQLCKGCHERAYKQFTKSMHSKSYSNPVFQAMYFKETVPMAKQDPEMAEEAMLCIACHNPVAYMTCDEAIHTEKDFGDEYANGTCDFCHTINGIKGDFPGNGNYISEPGEKKYGPHKTRTNWHHIYSPLQSSSKFCGTCHNGTNHKGLMTKSTYTEWLESRYADKGITCQDCHMSVIGFLSKDTPIFEKGKAAGGSSIIDPPERQQLHTHSFPGAYSTNQISGVIKLLMKTSDKTVEPGQEVDVRLRVDSRRAGHKIPTGKTDLRLLWIELNVRGNKDSFMVNATSLNPKAGGFDVVGLGKWDKAIIGNSVTHGHRVYRQIFLDESGNQTTSFYNAVKSIFDNRLEAASTRVEKYTFNMPKAKGRYVITATMKYLTYPESFAKRFDLPQATPLEIATVSKVIMVK